MRTIARLKLGRPLTRAGPLVMAALGLTSGAAGASSGWEAKTDPWGRFPYQGAVIAETNDPG